MSKNISVHKVDEASKLLCIQAGDKYCSVDKCDDWIVLSNNLGYCNVFNFLFRQRELKLDNVDFDSLLTTKEAKQEYADICVHQICHAAKCMGWVKIKEDWGCCIYDSNIAEKYNTEIVEGATNLMKIKRVWDVTYNVLVEMLNETQSSIENGYNYDEINYITIKVINDLISGHNDDKDNFYYTLKHFVKFNNEGEVLEIDSDFATMLGIFMMMGATMQRYLFIQNLAEKVKDV